MDAVSDGERDVEAVTDGDTDELKVTEAVPVCSAETEPLTEAVKLGDRDVVRLRLLDGLVEDDLLPLPDGETDADTEVLPEAVPLTVALVVAELRAQPWSPEQAWQPSTPGSGQMSK